MSQMYHQGSTLGRFAEGHAEVVSMGSQSCLRGSRLKKRILKSIVILNVVAMLMLATAATTFAAPGGEKGPPGGNAANGGLGTAAFMLTMVGVTDPAHPANEPTHAAACTITEKNPATSGDQTCP